MKATDLLLTKENSQCTYLKKQKHAMLCSQKLVHELRITNQVMYLNPPLEDARFNLFQELFSWESLVLTLPRIQHSRYQVCVGNVCY